MSLDKQFFNFRNRFNLNPHKFDIGRPIFQNRTLEDNFFVLKIYKLDNTDYEAFYQHQLKHYLSANPSHEETFFKHVYDIVVNRIKHFKRQDPFSAKYAKGVKTTHKLEAFLDYLKTIDRWHKSEPIESMIGEKDNLINKLKQRITELERQLKEANKYDAGEKIVISKGGLASFIHVIHQIQELTLPNENKLTRSQAQSPWYKMIAKYFVHGDKDISIETARNYFPAQRGEAPAKFIEIAEKDRLFKIELKQD
jgi:hypothetical protein